MGSFPTDIPGRKDVIARHRDAGGKIAAVFPIHYPRALYRAFGVQPIEVWGPPGIDAELGDAHLQQYTCSIVRNGLAFLLSGGLEVADLIVVPNTCDSLQGIGSALLDFHRPDKPVITQYNPRATGDSATDYFAAELSAIYDQLAGITGKGPGDDELREAIAIDEAADARLAELLDQRRFFDVTDREFYRLVRAREYLPAEEFTALAESALAGKSDAERIGVPLLLSGIVPEPLTVLDAITDAGAMIAADDLACSGRRRYPAGKSEKPLRRMAERLLGSPPDSTRCSPVAERAAYLRQLAAGAGVRNVVFYDVKFCEPEQFYIPQLRKALEQDGIRSVVIEVELSDPLPQQAVTQLEALLEMSV